LKHTSLNKDATFKISGWMTLYVLVLNLKSMFVNINLSDLIIVTIYRNVLEYIVPVVDLNYPQVS